ncbi:MAG: hypothetical protein ABI442_21365 [Gemmatimonadaceae bacterium]
MTWTQRRRQEHTGQDCGGLVQHRAGNIRVGGVVFDSLPVEQRARHVGLVFQDPSRQLFGRTVIDEAAFGPRALGKSASEAPAKRARRRRKR